MIKNPSDRMISCETKLSDENFAKLPSIIKKRENQLKNTLDIERAIWLMDELHHIQKIHQFNVEIRKAA